MFVLVNFFSVTRKKVLPGKSESGRDLIVPPGPRKTHFPGCLYHYGKNVPICGKKHVNSEFITIFSRVLAVTNSTQGGKSGKARHASLEITLIQSSSATAQFIYFQRGHYKHPNLK